MSEILLVVKLQQLKVLGRYKLKDRQEGTRIYHEVDQDGRVIRETMEVRGGRPAIDTELKSGGGRRSVEYNPGDQSGNRKDFMVLNQQSMVEQLLTRSLLSTQTKNFMKKR